MSGTVKITGVPVGQAGNLGKVDWNVSGSSISGTVNADAGHVIAWFKGEIADGQVKGTFTAVYGQSGTWEWEGPVPERSPGAQ